MKTIAAGFIILIFCFSTVNGHAAINHSRLKASIKRIKPHKKTLLISAKDLKKLARGSKVTINKSCRASVIKSRSRQAILDYSGCKSKQIRLGEVTLDFLLPQNATKKKQVRKGRPSTKRATKKPNKRVAKRSSLRPDKRSDKRSLKRSSSNQLRQKRRSRAALRTASRDVTSGARFSFGLGKGDGKISSGSTSSDRIIDYKYSVSAGYAYVPRESVGLLTGINFTRMADQIDSVRFEANLAYGFMRNFYLFAGPHFHNLHNYKMGVERLNVETAGKVGSQLGIASQFTDNFGIVVSYVNTGVKIAKIDNRSLSEKIDLSMEFMEFGLTVTF